MTDGRDEQSGFPPLAEYSFNRGSATADAPITCARDTRLTNPNAPGAPSAGLVDRAADGLARFMARWEHVEEITHDCATSGTEGKQ
ncbi:hypothetical protein ACGFNX_36915 [Streptomyces sp. NPDC048723]|uniref:hypothetical protein n=1 Tax=Streptomyces sp. NPDC048723 TaxID=3365589 RepID=UPI00372236AB